MNKITEVLNKYKDKSPKDFEIPFFDNVKVTILIPVFNQYAYTKDLVYSILKETKKINYEIIIADDNSNDETKNIENNIKNIKVLRNSTNKGFLRNAKTAVDMANGEYIMLLNNDMIVTPNWLNSLLEVVEKNPDIGIAGSTVLYPDATVQEQGSVIHEDCSSGWINHLQKFTPSANLKDVDYCSGCSILFKKEVWNKAGGFDERFAPAYYEDVDFCFSVKYKLGLRVVNVSNSTVFHFLSKTYKNSNISLSLRNRKIFQEKWHDILKEKDYSLSRKILKQERAKKGKLKFLQSIFSIKNYDQKHKVITILGIKVKIRRKYGIKYKQKYYSYYVNNENLSKERFVPITDMPCNNNSTIKPIAFYLPQFHSIELNDKNFGKGFTEWNNVAKAIPQFVGHNQPQLPYDVGFYNLSNDNIMVRQIELAKLYGIYGFCFHYYWFSGKRLLEKPIFNYLNNKNLNFPFCFCWANENWSKLWDGGNKEIILEQKLNDDDDAKFFYDILPFFKDERYIKIDNKPVLIIYRLGLFEKERANTFIQNIRTLSKKEGFEDIYVIGAKTFDVDIDAGFLIDAAVEFPPHCLGSVVERVDVGYINPNFVGNIVNIDNYVRFNCMTEVNKRLFKTVFPGWDNTARKAKTGANIFMCDPVLYKIWLKNIIKWTKVNHNREQERFIFINAWNEWAEGAHLEPDQRYGYAYLQATKEALEEESV